MSDEPRIREPDGLTSILAEYLTRIDRNESISRESLLAQHPEHAAELQNYFDDVDLVERLTQESAHFRSDSGPTTPRRFGDYELVREIGRGGMGIIYQAQECSTGRLVALKMLLHGLFLSPAEAARFRNEARTAAALRHPNIVPIYHVGEHDGHLFYTMPLIHGINLAQRLAAGPLEPRDAVRLLLAVAEAVDFAHASGVIHRDLKPANVLLDESGNPHVADFGLARRLGDESLSITATGDLLGTPNYMAPEQVNSSQELIGSTTDVYAMGAILYALLVGQPPFQSESVSETLQRICNVDPISPRKLNKRIPRDLETICLKCLEKSPTNRYRSAEEVADELRRFLGGTPLRARPVSRIERGRRWFVRNPVVGTLAVATALALVAGTAFSTYYALQSREREREALANLYAADMNLAQQHLRSGAVASAVRLLEKHRPPSSDMSTAPWEWRHLWHQCHGELRRFEGPQGALYCVSFSPDGRTVAAAGADKTLWLWETATGKVKHKFLGHTATIRDLDFAPDGQRLVTVGDDGRGIIWDTVTGNRLATLGVTGSASAVPDVAKPVAPNTQDPSSTQRHPLTTVAVSHDGRYIATGGNAEPNINIWDAQTAKLLQSLDLGPTDSLTFTPIDDRLAIAGRDGCVRVCQLRDRASWSLTHSIQAHSHIVRDLAWSPGGERLASAGADYVVKLWDTDSWREVCDISSFKEQIYSISFSPNCRRLVIAARNTPLVVWNLDQQQVFNELLGHTELVTCIDFCPEGWRLVSAGEDGTVRLWDASQAADHDRLEGHRGHVRTVVFSPSGDMLASGGAVDGLIILWNPITCMPIREQSHCGLPINDLAFSPDGRYLACALGFAELVGRVTIWDITANREKLSLALDPNQVGVAWAPDGQSVAVQAIDGTIRLLDANSGRELATQSSSKKSRGSIAFSDDGGFLITADGDETVRVWTSDTLNLLHEFVGHTSPVARALFNPQGSLIASSAEDRTIRLWDATTGKHLRTLAGHVGTPLGLAFTSDGARLASSSADQSVKIWDVANGLELQSLIGHVFWVRDIAFCADEQHLASAGYDGSVRIWHAPIEMADWAAIREAGALIRHLATRVSAPEPLLLAVTTHQTISEAVRAAAIDQAEGFLFYWTPMLAGHRAAERQDWATAVDAFERVTKLAPDEAIHWLWFAMASHAVDRRDAYQRACDELLGRYGADAIRSELECVIKSWLVSPHQEKELERLRPVIDTYARRWGVREFAWLYDLRRGTISTEFLEPADPPTEVAPGPAHWFVRAIAWHRVGDTAKTLSAYETGIREMRLQKNPSWELAYYHETLQHEVEELLGIESTSESSDLSVPITAVDSSLDTSTTEQRPEPPPPASK